jgi:hypothetical protein
MSARIPTAQEISTEIDKLVEEYRITCLWFAPADYLPKTDEQRLRALNYIERYGDREAFKRSRSLREWLLHPSKNA